MRVLLATDGSDCSRHALAEAARTLPLAAAEVHVVTVASRAPVLGAVEDGHLALQRAPELAQRELDAAVQTLTSCGVQAQAVLRTGDAAEEILAVARELAPDFIVVGCHGADAPERFMLDSVSNGVVQGWHGTVMLVRQPRASEAPEKAFIPR